MNEEAPCAAAGHTPAYDFPHCTAARDAGDEQSHERSVSGPEQGIENSPVFGKGAFVEGRSPEGHVPVVAQPFADGVGENVEQTGRGTAVNNVVITLGDKT